MSTSIEDQIRQEASNRTQAERSRVVKAAEDPGAKFTFHRGKRLPAEFKNPPCGTRFHRCTDNAGNYKPDWKQFRVYKTDNTQPDLIYVQAAAVSRGKVHVACHNYVKTGVWMDAPEAVVEVVRGARRETVDMATTDYQGNQLGLTGPQRIFRVVEDRPQYNCEVMASA